MTVCFTESQKQAIHDLCLTTLNKIEVKLKFLAKILGKFSSSFSGAPLGKLRYQEQNFKHKSLQNTL